MANADDVLRDLCKRGQYPDVILSISGDYNPKAEASQEWFAEIWGRR